MPDIGDALPAVLLQASEAELRATGFCPQPQVHILAEDMEHSYIGYVVCRRFYRGADAASAIAGLGLLPSALMATRLIVVWENRDLRTALELPGEGFPTGIAVLDARLGGHILHWHPFDIEVTGTSSHGIPTIIPHWRPPVRYTDVELLVPIAALLEVWREFRNDDLQRMAIDLQEAGYELNWAASRG